MIKQELRKMLFVTMPMVLTPLFSMLFMLLVARKASVENYGELAYVMTLISIPIGFSDLGLRDYFLSKDGLGKNYATLNVLFFFSSFIFLLILTTQYVFYIKTSSSSSIFALFSAISIEAYCLGVLHKTIYYTYQVNNNLTSFSKIDSLLKPLSISIKISAYFFLENIFISLICGSFASLVLYGAWFTKSCSLNLTNKMLFNEMKKLCSEWAQWGVYTISFISFFLYFGADKLIVHHLLGVNQLAIYSSAMSFMAIGQIIVGVLWSLYMPRLSRGEILWSYKKFILLLLALGLFSLACYQFFAYYIFDYIYPDAYKDGAHVLSLASVYFVFRFPNVVLEINYIVKTQYQAFVKMRLACGFFSIGLCFILLPHLGLKGAALSLVVTEIFLMIGSFVKLRRLSC